MLERLKLFWVFVKLGVVGEMEYRANFFVHLMESMVSLATGLAVLWVVFSQTVQLGGWGWNEILVVLGLWFVVSGIVNAMIAPSIRQFIHDVWLGDLDFLLIKPESHQFLVSTRKIMVFKATDLLIGVVILATALYRLGQDVGVDHALMFAVTLLSGAAILYSFWIVLGSLALWTVKLENLMLIFFHMFEAGRWPVGLYPFWLKYSLVFVVPIATAITVPAEAIAGRLEWHFALLCALYAAAALAGSRLLFTYAVRHKYMGASA